MSRARSRQKKEQLTLTLPAPRNPLALAGRQRRAGSHRKSTKALRQEQTRRLQKDLRED